MSFLQCQHCCVFNIQRKLEINKTGLPLIATTGVKRRRFERDYPSGVSALATGGSTNAKESSTWYSVFSLPLLLFPRSLPLDAPSCTFPFSTSPDQSPAPRFSPLCPQLSSIPPPRASPSVHCIVVPFHSAVVHASSPDSTESSVDKLRL